MKIFVTGAEGQLGKEIIRQLKNNNEYKIVTTNSKTLDISDLDSVDEWILKEKPDIVINCAAYTAVDLCEDEIEHAYKVNAIGPRNLAIISEKIGAKFVQISTDYVFDGKEDVEYREDDTTNPLSIYGKSKLMGEQFTRELCSKYFIIRTAWLYGDGKNFVKTMLDLSKKHSSITVVDDQFGTPTSTVDLADVIIKLINTENYGTYHGTCEGRCSWYEFANKIFELSNIDIEVIPISSDEYRTIAKRPMYSVLDNFMLELIGLNHFRHWESALEEYLEGV